MSDIPQPLPPVPVPQVDVSGRRLAHNTLLNLVGRVVPLLVGIATMPYVIRHLGPDRFGLLSLAWMVVGYFALFDLGIGPATTKFVAELLGKGEMEKLPGLVWTALFSQTCMGLAAGVLLAAASPLLVNRLLKIPAELHPQAHLIFLIMAAALPIDFASGSLRGVLAASQRFDLLNALGVPSSALTYLLPVVALELGFGLPAIVFFLVLARIAAIAILLAMCFRLHPVLRARLSFDRHLVGRLLGYGGWVTVSGAVGPFLLFFDRFLIGALVSVAAVGFYSVAFRVATFFMFIPSALAGPLLPAFSSLHGAGDSSRTTSIFLKSLQVYLPGRQLQLLALIIFAKNIFTLWVGGDFAVRSRRYLSKYSPLECLSLSLGPIASALLQGGADRILSARSIWSTSPSTLCSFGSWLTVGVLRARPFRPPFAPSLTLRCSFTFQPACPS